MTTEELVAKFRVNAEGVLSSSAADAVIDAVLNLERLEDAGDVTRLLAAVPATETIAAAR